MLKDLRRIHWEHDDIIKWKHFPHCWPFVRGIHWSQVNSLHQGQWCGVLMFSLICASINGWVNNHEAGDLRHHHSHYDFTVMFSWWWYCFIIIVFIKGIHSVPVDSSYKWPAMWSFDVFCIFGQDKLLKKRIASDLRCCDDHVIWL